MGRPLDRVLMVSQSIVNSPCSQLCGNVQVQRLMGAIGTDSELSDEEWAVLAAIGNVADTHPDAIAARLHLAMALADAPLQVMMMRMRRMRRRKGHDEENVSGSRGITDWGEDPILVTWRSYPSLPVT
jgi:hypothetical protein